MFGSVKLRRFRFRFRQRFRFRGSGSGVQGFRCFVFRCSSAQVFRCSGVQVSRYRYRYR